MFSLVFLSFCSSWPNSGNQRNPPNRASLAPLEENYASHDLQILAPTVRELVSAFSISIDAAWLADIYHR